MSASPAHPSDTVVVLANRHASRAADPRWEPALRACLAGRFAIEISSPETIDRLSSAAAAAADRRCHAVVVAGGDGTISRVANVLAGSDVSLGIIPLGTGNDFARTLGLPRDPVAAAQRIANGVPRRVDLVEVNGRCYTTVGLLGLPAEAALVVDRLTRPGTRTRQVVHATGTLAYRLAGARALLSTHARARRANVVVTGATVDREPRRFAPGSVMTHGFFITNGPHLGGGLELPVGASATDGVFEVCMVPAMPRARLLWAFLCLVYGWRIPAGALHVTAGTHAAIEYEGSVPFAADGDRACDGHRFDLRLEPGALTVLT